MPRALVALAALAVLAPRAHADEPALGRIDAAVTEAIGRGELPGAVVAVLHDNRVIYRKALGQRTRIPGQEAVPMTVDTVFDLASLTKPLATAACVMVLMEQGRLQPADRVAEHWPAFAANGKGEVTVEQLLLHTSGLTADNPVTDYADGQAKALERIAALKLEAPPGTRFRYSDIGYIVLGELVERISGRPFDRFAQERLFRPMGLADIGFQPGESLRVRAAPADQADGRWLVGEVHDPRSRALGGVAGHAGLFSTADDLLVYARMLLDGGTVNGRRILQAETVAAMTRPRPVPGGLRSWGWDVKTSYSANRGTGFPAGEGFGHTGFTGTSLWIDPGSRTAVVFLSNRLHPDGKGNVTKLRGQVATLAAEAVGGRRAEDRERKTEPKPTPPPSSILTGIDILEREQFARLKGKRVGLVTNHSGRDRDGRATIDLLHQAEGVKLVALFSPEHGIRGAVDAKVADSKDEKTGLPVYSLYGQRLKPTPETLQGIDTLVYDIQDAGCRYYTYISTLGGVLEAATAAKIKLIVLDRPNPIGGVAVAGPMLDAGRESFVGWHRLPVRHGLTVGELALLFNAERKIGCDLEVVKMEGWHRADLFDRTGLTWVNPSPNLRSLTQALLYPGIGLLETTNLSVGRGTDQPFEWIGAPWLDGRQLADALRVRNVPGVRWVPVSRTPTSSVFKGQACGGVQIIVDDWARFEPLRTGLTVAVELRRLYPDAWQVDKYDRLLGNKATLDGLKEGRSAEELERAWQPGLAEFLEVRKRYLYYEGSAGWAESVARGVPYLRKSQAADGTWSANVGRYKVGITGLALLALLSAGEGGEAVDRAVSALLKAQRPDGLIVGPDTGSGPMYDHGIATFALAQAALASPQLAAEIKPAVEKAVAVILKAQCRNGITRGGWRYRPEPTDGDMSVTPWQLLALRSARDLGCEVPDQALSDAFEFLRRCQNSTGGISYRPASGSATLGCTAGGVVVWALFAIVRAPRPDLEKAVDYLTEHPPRWGENFFFYTAYHQAHALALIGDDGGGVLIREGNLPTGGPFGPRAMGIPGPVEPEAKRTAPSEARQRLLGLLRDRQSADGGWPLVGTEGSVGRSYVTAMAVLALTSGDGRLSVNRRPAEKK